MSQKDGLPKDAIKKKRIAMTVLTVLVVFAVSAGLFYRYYSSAHVSTDDAFVEGNIHIISSKIQGTAAKIAVTDDQFVKAGDLLVELDPDIYSKKTETAEALYKAEGKRMEELTLSVESQRTKVKAASAALDKAVSVRDELKAAVLAKEASVKSRSALKRQAQTDLKRDEALAAEDIITKDRIDKTRTQLDTASSALDEAVELASQARAAVRSQEAAIKQSEADLKAAESSLRQIQASVESQKAIIESRKAAAGLESLNLSYTKITSPVDGYVTRKSVEAGNQIQPGQPMMSVVSLDDAYVIANIKETVLYLVKPGQKVDIKIDAYPGKKFRGKVESIMAGTGSSFTLFPPENASGNYIKVVQRVPVKIVFDNIKSVLPYLRVGMSIAPTILTKE